MEGGGGWAKWKEECDEEERIWRGWMDGVVG